MILIGERVWGIDRMAQDFIEWLKEGMFKSDLTAYALSQGSGVSQPHISKILRGEVTLPGRDVIIKLGRHIADRIFKDERDKVRFINEPLALFDYAPLPYPGERNIPSLALDKLEDIASQVAELKESFAGMDEEMWNKEITLLKAFEGNATLVGSQNMVVRGVAEGEAGEAPEGELIQFMDLVGGDHFLQITGSEFPPFSPGDFVVVSVRAPRIDDIAIVKINGKDFCRRLIGERIGPDQNILYTLLDESSGEESEATSDDAEFLGVVLYHVQKVNRRNPS